MACRTITTSVFAAIIMLAFIVPQALAVPETGVAFDHNNQSVKFWISGGDQDTVYTIEITPSGCVDTVVGTVNLTGPDDSGSVVLICLEPDSSGIVDVAFCLGVTCFDTKQLQLGCRSDCHIILIGQVPALTGWGTLVLIVLLVSTAIWVMRKKRVTA